MNKVRLGQNEKRILRYLARGEMGELERRLLWWNPKRTIKRLAEKGYVEIFDQERGSIAYGLTDKARKDTRVFLETLKR